MKAAEGRRIKNSANENAPTVEGRGDEAAGLEALPLHYTTPANERNHPKPAETTVEGVEGVEPIQGKALSTSSACGKGVESVGGGYQLAFSGKWRGVYWRDPENTDQAPQWICEPLEVIAQTRDKQNEGWGRWLRFKDPDGTVKEWDCPDAAVYGNNADIGKTLAGMGLGSLRGRESYKLGSYILRNTRKRILTVNRTGWHDDAFVLPSKTYGDNASEPVRLQRTSPRLANLGQGGTLAGWLQEVAAPCAGNTRLVLAVSMAFAAPCLRLLGAEGAGVHLEGPSSCGKTTALRVAASMYGPPKDYAGNWRATDNGMEALAAMHSDTLMVLDEIGQADPAHLKAITYLLGNGKGKARATQTGGAEPATQFLLLTLSAGEHSMERIMNQAGEKITAGQLMRLLNLPAVAVNNDLGVFDRVPEGKRPGAFSDELRRAAATHYGHALPAFLEALTKDLPTIRVKLDKTRGDIKAQLVEPGASSQVGRAADHFAIIAAAGELATWHGLTGWESGEAIKAAIACFNAWLDARGTAGNYEPAAMRAQVRDWLDEHGARFAPWHTREGDGDITDLAGYRKDNIEPTGPLQHVPAGSTVFYVDRETFRREVCKGFDRGAVERLLADEGALIKGGNSYTRPETPPGHDRATRLYTIALSLLGDQ